MRILHGRALVAAREAGDSAAVAAREKRLADFRARMDRRFASMVEPAADFDRNPRRARSKRWSESTPAPRRKKKKPGHNPRI